MAADDLGEDRPEVGSEREIAPKRGERRTEFGEAPRELPGRGTAIVGRSA